MNAAPGTPNRTSWLLLTGALTAAPVMYVVVASLISAEGRPVEVHSSFDRPSVPGPRAPSQNGSGTDGDGRG